MKGPTPKISEEQLLKMLMRKDKEGIRQLYQTHSGKLYGLAYRIVKRRDLAATVVQDALLKVWKNIDSFQPGKGSLLAWVVQITRNTALDMLRSKNYKADLRTQELATESMGLSQPVTELKVDHIGIKEQVNRLDNKYRELIEKVYFEGYSQSEVAKELSIPLGTVKSRVRKAVVELRRVLGA